MIASAHRAALLASEHDREAEAVARHFVALQAPARSGRRRSRARRSPRDIAGRRLSNLARAFPVWPTPAEPRPTSSAEAGRASWNAAAARRLRRFILNWAMWLHGLTPGTRTGRGAGSISNTSTSTPPASPRPGSPRTPGPSRDDRRDLGSEQLADALGIAHREGYRDRGRLHARPAPTPRRAGDEPIIAAELLGLARTCRFNATAHHVLHGVVVDPIVRDALGPPPSTATRSPAARPDPSSRRYATTRS